MDSNNITWIHEPVTDETVETIMKAYANLQRQNETLPEETALNMADTDAQMTIDKKLEEYQITSSQKNETLPEEMALNMADTDFELVRVSDEIAETINKACGDIQKAIDNELENSTTTCEQKNDAPREAIFITDSDAQMTETDHSGNLMAYNLEIKWIHEPVSAETVEKIFKAYTYIQRAIDYDLEDYQTTCSQYDETLPEALYIPIDLDDQMATEVSAPVDDIIDKTSDDDDNASSKEHAYNRIIDGEIKHVKCDEEKDRIRKPSLTEGKWNPFSGVDHADSTEEDAVERDQGETRTVNNGNGKRPLDDDEEEPPCSNKRNRL